MMLIAGVPSSQALPGFLITAPPSVCVSAVLGALAVWYQTGGFDFFESIQSFFFPKNKKKWYTTCWHSKE